MSSGYETCVSCGSSASDAFRIVARQSSRPDAASPRARRSLASTRPSASCFAAEPRSAGASERLEQPLPDRLAEEEVAILAHDRHLDPEGREERRRVDAGGD